MNRDREGRLAEECCCIQPLGAEQKPGIPHRGVYVRQRGVVHPRWNGYGLHNATGSKKNKNKAREKNCLRSVFSEVLCLCEGTEHHLISQ